MQLRIQRSQRAGRVLGNTVFFCLDVRADYSPEERDNVRKYRLGGEVIYNSTAARRHLESAGAHLDRTQQGGLGERTAGLARGLASLAMAKMRLNISIASLGRGHHIECKNLEELLEAEETVREACKNVTRWLEIAATFNGSEVVIDYENGEERVHISQDAIPLLEYASMPEVPLPSEGELPPLDLDAASFAQMGQDFKRLYLIIHNRWHRLEQWLIASAKAKGVRLSELHVRFFAVIVGFLALVLLAEIF